MVKNEDRVLSVIKSRTGKRERKKNERLPDGSQDLYRNLFENSHDAIYITDTDGNFVDINPAFNDLFGYSKEETKELTGLDFHVDPRYRVDLINEIRKNDFVKDFEVKLRRSNGTIIDCLISANARTSQDGVIIGYQGIIHDVTDRKVAEKVAKDFKWILDNTLDSVFMFDPVNLQFNYVNKGAIDQVGYSKEKLLKMTPLDIKPEFVEKSFRKMLMPLMAGTQKSITFETVHKRKDGELIPVEVFLQHSSPPNGKPRFMAIVRDISNRKERDEEVRKLSYAIGQSANSVVITDTNGNIEYVNPKFEKITGYTFDEVKGKNLRILKSGETPREEYEKLWKRISSGKIWTGEFHNKKKNGELYWEKTSISPIKNESGVITHYLAIKEDITAQKRLVAKLTQKTIFFRENPSPVLQTKYDGTIINMNPAAKEVFGRSMKEKSIFSLLPSLKKSHLRKITIDKPIQLEETIGGICCLFTFKKDKKTKSLYIYGADVTALKSAENALLRSKKSFHNVVDRNVDGILVIDAGGIVRYVNPTAETLFGRKAKDLLNRQFGLPIVEGDVSGLDIIRKNRERGIAEMRTVGTVWEGEDANLLLLRDITEQKKVEERLQKEHELVLEANKELRKAFAKEEKLRSALTNAEKLASLGEMASKIAHEINNLVIPMKSDTCSDSVRTLSHPLSIEA